MNYLGISKKEVAPTVGALNTLLSNYQVYYQNLRNFHWNVTGKNFFELHEKFEELYTDARIKIDEIAERILTLRSRPLSRLTDYLEISEIAEATLIENDEEMVAKILADHRLLLVNMRAVISTADAVNDEGTIDMIGGFIEELEKVSWMLDAWLQPAHRKIKATA